MEPFRTRLGNWMNLKPHGPTPEPGACGCPNLEPSASASEAWSPNLLLAVKKRLHATIV